MKVLITGITGFVGSHLAEYAVSKGVEVYGTVRWRSKMDNISHIRDKIRLEDCDLKDAANVYEIVNRIRPDWIFHLAAQNFVPTSWRSPGETLTTNILGQLNILEAVRKKGIGCRIHVAGPSEEYGMARPDELPVNENTPLRPLSPHGVSKIGQDLLAYQYYQSYSLEVIRTRAFNHTGPRRGEVFVCSNFSKQIVEIERGNKKPVIYVGNLEAKRGFSDVRDIVRAYWLALEKGEPGDLYVIASGKAYSIREVLDILLEFVDVRVEVCQDPDRMRPSDVPTLVGASTKFRKQTGWEPEIPFEKTLQDLLNYWRGIT